MPTLLTRPTLEGLPRPYRQGPCFLLEARPLPQSQALSSSHPPVPLKPAFPISLVTGSIIHSASPNRTLGILIGLFKTSPRPLGSIFRTCLQPPPPWTITLSKSHVCSLESLQQPPCWPPCLQPKGLYPMATKPSGPALATPPMSTLTTLRPPVPWTLYIPSYFRGLCTCCAHCLCPSLYLPVIWVSALVTSSKWSFLTSSLKAIASSSFSTI